MLSVGSLFTGIGGFDLGFERAGMRVAWQCESDEFCRRVLAKHWPGVPCYEDVQTLDGGSIESIDVLCGGFPCQDISVAGRGAGLAGSRSGLWSEFARLIGELGPSYVVVENVPALRRRGLAQVLEDLTALGYDAEWDGLSASAVGAPHQRDRIWIVAYPSSAGSQGYRAITGQAQESQSRHDGPSCRDDVADSHGVGQLQPDYEARSYTRVLTRESARGRSERGGGPGWAPAWSLEPDVGRVAHGVPARVDRLRALGNALVPQLAEWIGARIIDYEGRNYARSTDTRST